MSETANGPEEMDALRGAVLHIAGLLATEDYQSVIQACSESRLSADDMRTAIDEYGGRLIPPPKDAYASLDTVRVTKAIVSTWSLRVPLYTAEEGRSDLTLELTIVQVNASLEVELDDIHVL